MQRRQFLGYSALLLAAFNEAFALEPAKKQLRIGICADVHKDIMHDADERLKEFVDMANGLSLDFILQLGDFCVPQAKNESFMAQWHSYRGQKYHVLGNHDMDNGYSKQETLKFWNGIAPYYSFDSKGFHFIVLDGNDLDPSPNKPKGYARYIGKEQLLWLEEDIRTTALPIIVFCHQGLDNDLGGITNATQTRRILEKGNVKIVFSGHHHQDYVNEINDILYVQINSMSYHWVGAKYQKQRYSAAIDHAYPTIKKTIPYENPLYAFVTISSTGDVNIIGKQSSFVGPGPEALGLSDSVYPIVPRISNRQFKLII